MIDPLALLDPGLREATLARAAAMARFTPMTHEKLVDRRALMAAAAPTPGLVPVERRTAPGYGGHPDVPLYVVNPRPGALRGGIVHLHGGGFIASSAAASVPGLQALAATLDCAIVSVDYRLAPETTFAGSLEDNHAGLLWTHAHGAEIGLDPTRIVLLGESAGGGHAALLALAARDRGTVPLLHLALLYPMLDDRTASSRAVPEHIGHFGWNGDANRFAWRCFLGREPGRDMAAAGVPARAADLARLPPTFIACGALDLFVGESIDFARRLMAAGVPTELHIVPGAHHGFDMLVPEAEISRRFAETKIAALRRALG